MENVENKITVKSEVVLNGQQLVHSFSVEGDEESKWFTVYENGNCVDGVTWGLKTATGKLNRMQLSKWCEILGIERGALIKMRKADTIAAAKKFGISITKGL
jgi:hypothetical protein